MVRAVILAAGFGSRLMPLTRDRPKGMVPLAGLPLLARQVAVMRACGITDISLVGGYQAQRLQTLGLPVIRNEAYETTNMVESLMCARALMDGRDDLVMAYGDIVYEHGVLRTVMDTQGDIVVAADRRWRALWGARMDDYASDVETFRLRGDGSIAELGRRPKSLDEVQAQYIGLVRFPAPCHARLLAFYDGLDRTATYDGQPFPKMYMTSFIQQLIDHGWNVRPALIDSGWLEVDTLEDLQRYERLAADGGLDALCRLSAPPGPEEIIALMQPAMPPAAPGLCDVGALAARLPAAGIPDADTLGLLDRLARKIEIMGTLYRRYTLADMKAVEAQGVASPAEAAALLAAYILAFDRTGDPRHLNTVLKALDGTLQEPRPAMQHELDHCCATRLGEYG
jgi:choline kinase